MAIAPDTKSAIQLLRNMRSEIETRTGITNFDSDSKTRALMDVFIEEILNARTSAINSFYSNQLSNATGANLDAIGQTMGVERLLQTFAQSNARERCFAFYVDSGTFGAINGGADITIPRGTLLSSDPDQNELGAVIQFRTTSEATLTAADSVGYVSVRAELSGTSHNIGSGVIRNHTFTSYTAGTGLKVVNFYAVLNGRATETDEQFRFRLSRNYNRLMGSNDQKVHLTALQVPGVLDTRVLSGYFGIGTAGVLVLGADYQSNTALVAAVQQRLNNLFGPGLKAVATAATEVSLDLELELKTLRTLTTREKQLLEASVRQALMDQVRSVGIGGTVTLGDLGLAVQQKARGLVRIGNRFTDENNMFKKVYLIRGFSNGSSSERETLVSTTIVFGEDEYPDLGTITFTYV